MEQNLKIITTGSIIKQEIVKTLDVNILPNTLVMEIMEPFPGYHGANLPTDSLPRSVFLATTKLHSDEDVLRITERINKSANTHFIANPAVVNIYSDQIPSIRLWGVEGYDFIPELQEGYKTEGIEFRKKRNLKDVALLKINKSFHIEEIEEGVYRDVGTPKMYYVQIPYISWNLFEEITKYLKNNIDNKNFDVAQGLFFLDKVVDVVRVYGQEVSIDYLKALRDKYITEIDKFYT